MDWFRLKACLKCRGDLVLDAGDWLCLQCGTYYYTGLYHRTGAARQAQPDHPRPRQDKVWVSELPRAVLVSVQQLSPALATGQFASGMARTHASGAAALQAALPYTKDKVESTWTPSQTLRV